MKIFERVRKNTVYLATKNPIGPNSPITLPFLKKILSGTLCTIRNSRFEKERSIYDRTDYEKTIYKSGVQCICGEEHIFFPEDFSEIGISGFICEECFRTYTLEDIKQFVATHDLE